MVDRRVEDACSSPCSERGGRRRAPRERPRAGEQEPSWEHEETDEPCGERRGRDLDSERRRASAERQHRGSSRGRPAPRSATRCPGRTFRAGSARNIRTESFGDGCPDPPQDHWPHGAVRDDRDQREQSGGRQKRKIEVGEVGRLLAPRARAGEGRETPAPTDAPTCTTTRTQRELRDDLSTRVSLLVAAE